ncbi:MAG: efflux transporter outer membrane subunit [Alphaproteobacteria bacterium]|nr:efflux transporter outer membrane subunit [Alphaproteobacteria bacterium]
MRPARSWSWVASLSAIAVGLAGCDLAPAYQPPNLTVPAHYQEVGAWTPATPADAAPRGDWWTLFGDPTLNALERQVDQANPNLAAAVASYDASRAYAAEAASALYPSLGALGTTSFNRQSVRRPTRGPGPNEFGDNALGLAGFYQIDFWGQVRNEVAAGRAQAQASAANLAVARLGLQAELANDYLILRGLDAQLNLLDQTVIAYEKAVELTTARHSGGASSGLDVDRAMTQLASAKAQISDVAGQRALYEHAIASLIGQSASDFRLAPALMRAAIPAVPAGVPSTLLQRRPDIAAAERQAYAANRAIGVAKAAFFPNVTLAPGGGFQNNGEWSLFTIPNSYWTIGPQLALPLFEGGLRHAQLAAAEAQFRVASSTYRATVLKAFQQVEDQLALANHDAQEAIDEAQAVKAAQATTNLSLVRYREGATNYLEVVVAQTAELQAEQTALSLETARQQASVNLVVALGGGWSRTDLPSPGEASRLRDPDTARREGARPAP